jgi:hypothetical protein
MLAALVTRVRARTVVPLLALVLLCTVGLVAPPGSMAAGGGSHAKIEHLTRHIRADLKGILVRARAQLIELARLPSVRAGNSSACNTDMASRAGSPRYTALGAADLAGNLYCLSTPFTPPVSIADRPYFLRALGTGDLGVGDFQIGRVLGQGSVGLGFPVRAGGRTTGIVLSPLTLAWLDPRVERERKRPARDVLVVDDHGTVLAHAGPTSVAQGTNLGGTALVKKALRFDRSQGPTRFGGKRVFAAIDVVPLSGDGMHVAVTGRL